MSPQSFGLSRLPAAVLAGCVLASAPIACSPGPTGTTRDPAARKAEYQALERRVAEQVREWQEAGGRRPDPRPDLADDLAGFARRNSDGPEAPQALTGAMELRAARYDTAGFFNAYELMLEIAADSPALRGEFAQIPVMRLVEAGGPFIMQNTDIAAKRTAYLAAVPAIVSDLQKAIDVTKNPANIAAAHYAIGSAWYQFEVDPGKALEHFRLVAERHPNWAYSDSAREYVRELENFGIGKPAPDFSGTALRGKQVSLSGLKGRIVLVDFWATWCQLCAQELPDLQRAYDRFASRGFTIIGVNLDNDLSLVDQFLELHRPEWPTLASGKAMADPVVRLYGVQAIPMSYLVDREGIIRGRALLGRDVETAVAALIDKRASPTGTASR